MLTVEMRNQVLVEAARLTLGGTHGERLVTLCDQLLTADCYTDAIAELAACTDPILSTAKPIFRRVLTELQLDPPSNADATWILLRHHLARIVGGDCSSRDGMRCVAEEVYYPADLYSQTQKYVGDSHGIEHLMGAYYGYDDLEERPNEVSFDGKYGAAAIAALDDDIRRLAAEWLEAHPGD